MGVQTRLAKMPLIPLSGDIDYVALRTVLIDGTQLAQGDHLPGDSPVRENPKRLEALCRLRTLAPTSQLAKVATPEAGQSLPQSVNAQSIVAEHEQTPLVNSLSLPELREQCKALKLRTDGNRSQLRKRLRIALG